MYVFGGYVTGDKANDLWSYSLTEGTWTCLNKGDYRQNHQDPNKIPAPRVGAKMVQLNSTTLLLHNGHDNDNEKIEDTWQFDLNTKEWTMVDQDGDVPPVSYHEDKFMFYYFCSFFP